MINFGENSINEQIKNNHNSMNDFIEKNIQPEKQDYYKNLLNNIGSPALVKLAEYIYDGNQMDVASFMDPNKVFEKMTKYFNGVDDNRIKEALNIIGDMIMTYNNGVKEGKELWKKSETTADEEEKLLNLKSGNELLSNINYGKDGGLDAKKLISETIKLFFSNLIKELNYNDEIKDKYWSLKWLERKHQESIDSKQS